MPHIHAQPGQHDHTVSIYLFRTDFSEPKVMLHLHKKLGSYMQFGGHIELNETPWQTIVHELKEESGYDINQIQILQPSARITRLTDAVVHPYPVGHVTHPVGEDHFHTDSAYAIITDETPHHAPDDGESTDIKLFSRQEILALTNDDIIENVREIIMYIFDSCLALWQPIAPDKFK